MCLRTHSHDMGCGNSKRVDQAATGPDMVLLKLADLLNNPLLSAENDGKGVTSHEVLEQHWNAKKSIAGVFGAGSFVTIPWSQLKATKYAVLTYGWGGCTWSQIIKALKKKGEMKVEYVWIDIFCLDQNDPNKMETIKRTADIYGWADEYHVMGFNTFKRGWCQCELGVTTAPPIFYSNDDGLEEEVGDITSKLAVAEPEERRAEVKQLLGFEAAGFTVEADRPTVRTMIEAARGSVESFDEYLVDKVQNDAAIMAAAVASFMMGEAMADIQSSFTFPQ